MIRAATPEDLPRLRALQLASLAEPWDGLLEPAIEGPPVVLVSTPRGHHGAATALDADTPVGYAVAVPEGADAYLAELAVAAGHRREGHGSALLDALADRLVAAGHERLTLTVHEGDRRARAFYDSHGFGVRSLLPEHYEDGDALVLARPVQASSSN
ncbi:GNAT family N-acetyltransferase [Halorientalis litorea]|jgi:ribosomal-protein-alanine N-acetyltransferase|uniref:GNAT family N-acetyltransferase n=1 Tax=Halorientalis litorea TaxID=2931977 RepID=UPI001FF16ECF|nr:N-acetyltransferase [Halorientalis litorea]